MRHFKMEGATHQHHLSSTWLCLWNCAASWRARMGPKWPGLVQAKQTNKQGRNEGRKVKAEKHLPCGLLLLSSANDYSFSNSWFFAKGFCCKSILKKLLMKQFQQYNRWHQETSLFLSLSSVSLLWWRALPACRSSITILHSAAQMLSLLRHTGTVVFPCKRVICVDICKKEGFVCYWWFGKTNVTQKRNHKQSRQVR